MKLLLDTHIWIWSFLEPYKVSSEVSQALTNPQNDRFLASISIWEAILLDRKSTRLNSSHGSISYAVFCLKKKKGRSNRNRLKANQNGKKFRVRIKMKL